MLEQTTMVLTRVEIVELIEQHYKVQFDIVSLSSVGFRGQVRLNGN